jgi:uncharacterized integral membrane protein
MFRKIVSAVILIPLLVLFVAFAVANRQSVTVSFDPFSSTAPAYVATLPLYAIIFIVLILGVVIGGVASWISQRYWRRATKRLDAEVRSLHEEMDAMRRQLADTGPPQQAAPVVQQEMRPPLVLPPIG